MPPASQTSGVMEPVRLDPQEVAVAVRALLHKETERATDALAARADRVRRPEARPVESYPADMLSYEPESWRWFELVDLGYVADMVLVTFRWTDPSTPELRYCYLTPAGGLPNSDAAAVLVRAQLRRLLHPG